MLDSTMVNRGFEPRSGQTKDYKIGICCCPAKARIIKEKEQRFLNVSEWGDMLFQ